MNANNANHSAIAPELASNIGPAPEAASSNPLNHRYQRFNIEAFQKHGDALGRSARALDRAYQTAYAIECIMNILVADDTERDRAEDGGQPLDLYLRGGLTTAILQMAAGLHHDLCHEADGIEEMIKRQQGGAV